MKKVILSLVCLFAISTIANAISLGGTFDCVDMAIEVGNWAEERGASDMEAYEEANQAYEDCIAWQS